jgi:hypothetical protein
MLYWKASNLEYLPALGNLSFVTCWSGPLCNLYISTFDGKLGPGAREAAGCDAFSVAIRRQDRMLFHVTSCYIYMDIRGYNMALRFWCFRMLYVATWKRKVVIMATGKPHLHFVETSRHLIALRWTGSFSCPSFWFSFCHASCIWTWAQVHFPRLLVHTTKIYQVRMCHITFHSEAPWPPTQASHTFPLFSMHPLRLRRESDHHHTHNGSSAFGHLGNYHQPWPRQKHLSYLDT